MEQIQGGITAAKGFLAAHTAAGIKYQDRADMAMIFSRQPCRVAGVFTSNVVKAAPVVWDKERVETGKEIHAVVINAGIANACTGKEGMNYCKKTAQKAAKTLSISEDSVLLASTGVIGKQLPIERITAGIDKLTEGLSCELSAGTQAAKAIMTTDTKHKEIAVTFEACGVTATIGGMCKGSGMIHPNMCTMLAFLTTDFNISKELLQKALKEDVKETFNMISVDGDTSTNDTLLLLSNGMAGNEELTKEDEQYDSFKLALHTVTEFLAKSMAADGEGATKLLEVRILGAEDKNQAAMLAKSIISSNLVKTAVYGNDANWGRILCAMGYAGVNFIPEQIDLWIESEGDGQLQLVKDGTATDYSEKLATKILSAEQVNVIVDLKIGYETATAWGCDLTHDYIKINADYRS